MKLFAGATIGLGLVAALFISFYLKLWYDVFTFLLFDTDGRGGCSLE
jgi:hypothetical protein